MTNNTACAFCAQPARVRVDPPRCHECNDLLYLLAYLAHFGKPVTVTNAQAVLADAPNGDWCVTPDDVAERLPGLVNGE